MWLGYGKRLESFEPVKPFYDTMAGCKNVMLQIEENVEFGIGYIIHTNVESDFC
jgi:hypothetical protein